MREGVREREGVLMGDWSHRLVPITGALQVNSLHQEHKRTLAKAVFYQPVGTTPIVKALGLKLVTTSHTSLVMKELTAY